jgi:hypothetical protein
MPRSSKGKRGKRSSPAEPSKKPPNPGLPDPSSVVEKKTVILGGKPVTIIKTTEKDSYDEQEESQDQQNKQ